MKALSSPDIGLYIHIPFCKSKCNYCSFISFALKPSPSLIKDYFTALKKEIQAYRNLDKQVKTIYIGGGTPSILPAKYISSLLKDCLANFKIKKNAEITIEINPATINKSKVKAYQKSEINRISLGAQSFNDEFLSFLGRAHNSRDIYDSFKLCRKAGIQNINLDLIFGFKRQNLTDWTNDLKKAIELNPEHIALYDLSIEPKSKFYNKMKKGEIFTLSEAKEIKMYKAAQKILTSNGYQHYEISNFALAGKESRHNLTYWDNEAYLGLGLGAISYIERSRYGNTKNLEKYIRGYNQNKPFYINKERLSSQKMAVETLILNLRKLKTGAFLKKIEGIFNVEISDSLDGKLKYLINNKLLLKKKSGQISLTQKGILLFDYIAARLL